MTWHVTVVDSGTHAYPRDVLFPGQGLTGTTPVPHQFLLLTGPGVVLVDLGLSADAWRAALRAAGLTPGDVDVVVLTHLHPDHVGGLVDGGLLTLPRARIALARREWDYWADERNLSAHEGRVADAVRPLVPALRDSGQLELLAPPAVLLPGLQVEPAYGHTPGHVVVRVAADPEVLWTADVLACGEHAEAPERTSGFDADPALGAQVRTRVLADPARLLGAHVPASGQ